MDEASKTALPCMEETDWECFASVPKMRQALVLRNAAVFDSMHAQGDQIGILKVHLDVILIMPWSSSECPKAGATCMCECHTHKVEATTWIYTLNSHF